jgi:hypothetical protein
VNEGRFMWVVLIAFVLLAAACGGSDAGSPGGGGGGGTSGGATSTGDGDHGDGGDGGGESFSVDTELNLGQAFAEEPMFDGALGSVTVNVRTDRGGGSNAAVPITFRLANSGQTGLDDVAFAIHFTVLPPLEPEDPPVPAPDDPPLELAPQTTAGTCAAEDTTSSSTVITCTLGTLTPGTEATITVTSPKWFRLSIEMKLTARMA